MKNNKLKAKKPLGFNDKEHDEILYTEELLRVISTEIDKFGFNRLITPSFEYSDILGKYLPDDDRPNKGVFSIQDNKNWLSLRFDLTAPLARYVVENYQNLKLPFKRQQYGYVFRNEKPDPGRYREFIQFDADIIGSSSLLSEVELFQILDVIFKKILPEDYKFKTLLSDRRIFLSLVDHIKDIDDEKKGIIFKAIDKYDRLGLGAVAELLGEGRKDSSGDFTIGANIEKKYIDEILYLLSNQDDTDHIIDHILNSFWCTEITREAVNDLLFIIDKCKKINISDGVAIDFSIIRGLEYYTSSIFETILIDPNGNKAKGSIAGGGRYDKLTKKFINQDIPSVGVSFGISRIINEIYDQSKLVKKKKILITNMIEERQDEYFKLARELQNNGFVAFVYPSNINLGKQLKYADKTDCDFVIIEGEDELKEGVLLVKDLVLGKEIAKNIKDRDEWVDQSKTQFTINRFDLEQISAYLKKNYNS